MTGAPDPTDAIARAAEMLPESLWAPWLQESCELSGGTAVRRG